MKTKIPEDLKADLPQSKWGKILGATPVVLAVVSTLLAGLASSEMTKAQYDRSLAAQLQSKAGDQWSFFQAKRLRSALQNNTLDLLSSSGARGNADGEAWLAMLTGTPAASIDAAARQQVLAVMRDGTLPKLPLPPAVDPNVHAALEALETARSDTEMSESLAKVEDAVLESSVRVV